MKTIFHVAAFVVLSGAASAQGYDGLCFPGNDCTGPVPIIGNAFSTCEENCVMEEATTVRGMDASLFDVTCRGDSGSYAYRMMLARIMTDDGLTTFSITNESITPLLRCPG